MNRSYRGLVFGAFVTLAVAFPFRASAERLVELDASTLTSGTLSSWPNKGALQGSFEATSMGGAVVGIVTDRKAVTFDGSGDFLRSSFPAPAAITGANPFTVAVWVHNPKVNAGEEPLVYWAHRGDGQRAAHLNYGNSKTSGAVVHWGADLGYAGGAPAEGKWHLIALTYEGGREGLESLYVDGNPNASAKRSLDLFSGDPIYIATTDFERFFSGSMAEVWIFDYALPGREIAGLMSAGATPSRPALVHLSARNLPEGRLGKWPNDGSIGGSFGLESSAPRIVTLKGRRAVSFGPKTWLQSSWSANPVETSLTVEYWVCREELDAAACPVLSFGDRQNGEMLRFGYSAAPKNGAFIYGRSSAGFNYPAPPKGEWHHIAYTVDNASTISIYVDGELAKRTRVESRPGRDTKMLLGGAWVRGRGIPLGGPQLAVSRLRVYDKALPQREIRNNGNLFNAFAPQPANRGRSEGFGTQLRWSEGASDIAGADVYFGMNKQEIADADRNSKAFLGTVPSGRASFGPITTDLDKTYYWRADEVGGGGEVRHKGDVWEFASESGNATRPIPRARISGVPIQTASLNWTPGKYATRQAIRFSASKSDVESGKALLADGLQGSVDTYNLQNRGLEYGKTYYWRVANENGQHSPSPGETWTFRTEDKLAGNDITFFVVSDLHYDMGPTIVAANESTIDFMNLLPGSAYPKEVGGEVMTPRGVVMTGDLTNDGTAEQWTLFTADWGVNGEGRIAYPVYEGFGNHDGSMAPGRVVAAGIAERNKTRPGVKNISDNGIHYSWDWDQLHMVQLNFYAGDLRVKMGSMDGPGHEPLYSLKFLKADLEKNVGTSGRPVIIAMHLGFDEGFSMGWGWWAEREREAFYEAIRNYNVIGILYGHTHAAAHYQWRGLDIYNCASSQRDPDPGECMVFHVTPRELVVTHRFSGRWSEVWRKPIQGLGGAPPKTQERLSR